MLYIFNRIDSFKARGIGTVVLPCFLSHTFMEELKENSPLPIADMIEVLRAHVRSTFPKAAAHRCADFRAAARKRLVRTLLRAGGVPAALRTSA